MADQGVHRELREFIVFNKASLGPIIINICGLTRIIFYRGVRKERRVFRHGSTLLFIILIVFRHGFTQINTDYDFLGPRFRGDDNINTVFFVCFVYL